MNTEKIEWQKTPPCGGNFKFAGRLGAEEYAEEYMGLRSGSYEVRACRHCGYWHTSGIIPFKEEKSQ